MECESQHITNKLPSSLLRLLSNPLILDQTAPCLPIYSLLALGATSKSFKELIHETPHVHAFRRLDLSNLKSAKSEIRSNNIGNVTEFESA